MSPLLRNALGAAALGLVLCGCPPPNTTMDSGVPDAGCDGLIGCQCAAGACTTGECLADTCVDCRRGEAACICRSTNTCNAGLRCATGRCETCPAGEPGCPCGTGDTCGAGLICSNGMCVADTCVAGTARCPCRPGAPACDSTLYCDSTLCQACSNDVIGCPCDGVGQCAGTTVCNATTQTCRAAITCAQLVANGTCAPNQACVEPNGADAQCVPDTCIAGFRWNGVTCVACVSAGCANEPSCSDLDGGLGTNCATLHRSCNAASSTCGACLPRFTANPSGQCIAVPDCGGATCTFTQYCNRTGSTPTCTANPSCAPGQATTTTGACAACAPVPTCTGAGFSGRVWPFMTAADVCVCETLDDYFLSGGGNSNATACDLDGDGWVREEAGDNSVTGDPAFSANARCLIKSVNQVRLYDEYGLSIDVLSCVEGLVKTSAALVDGGVPNGGIGVLADGGLMRTVDGGNPCSAYLPMRLLETPRNDIPGNPSGANRAPTYGSSGRLLEANELNSLTKACTSIAGDYNDNKLDDIAEVQGTVAPISERSPPAADRARLESFAYFVELDSAAAEGSVLDIRERSRCDATFPFHYAPDAGSPTPNDSYVIGNDKPYWRACARNRDPDYAANNPRPGFDFANYGCDTTSLSCPLIAPAHPTSVAPVDPRTTKFRDFGLCRMGGSLPADGLWRGMNHHSQFKCVNVIDVGVTMRKPFDRVDIEFGQLTNQLTFETCAARPCPPGDTSCSSPQGTTMEPQTRQPVIDCTARAGMALTGSVGFAALNYRPYRLVDTFYPGNAYGSARAYSGGCVNEDDKWDSFLCPYPEFVLSRALADAQFGRYSCYKYESNFVFAGPLPDGGTNAGDRATLRFAANTNASVLGPRPPPPDGGL